MYSVYLFNHVGVCKDLKRQLGLKLKKMVIFHVFFQFSNRRDHLLLKPPTVKLNQPEVVLVQNLLMSLPKGIFKPFVYDLELSFIYWLLLDGLPQLSQLLFAVSGYTAFLFRWCIIVAQVLQVCIGERVLVDLVPQIEQQVFKSATVVRGVLHETFNFFVDSFEAILDDGLDFVANLLNCILFSHVVTLRPLRGG